MQNNCLLIGAGYMAREYIKVLKKLNVDFLVVGRGEEKINEIKKIFNVAAVSGGLLEYAKQRIEVIPQNAIVAVSIEELVPATLKLIQMGVRNILVEKPLGLNLNEIEAIVTSVRNHNANVYVAYNRRFYASVIDLKKKVEEDGGITSINFEFTEWIHTIDTKKYAATVLDRFVIANSSHVIDTVFHLAGRPRQLHAFVSRCDVDWHKSGSIFVGAGVTEHGVLFSYASNWGAPGRWAIEVCTSKRRYYLKPLERLAIQEKGSVQVEKYEADYAIDDQFKPGLMKMIKAFFELDTTDLCSVQEQQLNFPFYEKIAAY